MAIDTTAIIKLIIDLMGEQQIQVKVGQSLKCALITGACTFVGDMVIAGPVGIIVGGVSGVVIASAAVYQTNGNYKTIQQILKEMSSERRQKIAEEIKSIIEKLEINDLSQLIPIASIGYTLSSSGSQPNHILIQQFIQQTIPVIQRIYMNPVNRETSIA